MSPNIESIKQIEITCKGIEKLLSNLDSKKANGPDKLPTRVLRETFTEIAPIFRVMFERSLVSGEIISIWKTGNIVPVDEGKGSKHEAVNYRQIALTSVPCKILEHIIFKHLMEHCEYHILLMKLENYSIGADTSVGKWIRTWLLDRTQKVIVEGKAQKP